MTACCRRAPQGKPTRSSLFYVINNIKQTSGQLFLTDQAKKRPCDRTAGGPHQEPPAVSGGWVERVSQRLVHCHMNNHRGFYDEHLPLDIPGGVIDYKRDVLPLLHALPSQPFLVLEMDEIESLERSLRYLGCQVPSEPIGHSASPIQR